MLKKILIILIFTISFCSHVRADVNFQMSAGFEEYSETVGFDANLSVYFPFKLISRKNADINPGIMLFGSYTKVGDLKVFGVGSGIDLGYIISLNWFHIIPSVGIGYLWNIVAGDDSITGFGTMYAYPHLLLTIDLSPSITFGLGLGYRITFLNSDDNPQPNPGNNFVINLTVGIKGIENKNEAIESSKEATVGPDKKVSDSESTGLPSDKTASNIADTKPTKDNIDTEEKPISVEKAIADAKSLVSSGNKEKAIDFLEGFLRKHPDNEKIKEILILLKSPNIDIEKIR